MKRIVLLLTALITTWFAHATEIADICIYGGTSSGVMAAYTASKAGKKVILIEPTDRIGGLTTGGLGATDIGNPYIMKGYTYNFYRSIGQYYGTNEMKFAFEPKVALGIYQQYIDDTKVLLIYNHRLLSVEKEGNTIRRMVVEDTSTHKSLDIIAKEYIDCTYEGDLMARAGVSYTVGREDNAQYGETWNGAFYSLHHQFPDYVDPYVIPGKPESGLLYGILGEEPPLPGKGDKHIQAYNFRITLTDDPENLIPITEPANYDPSKYELLIRLKERSPFSDWGLEDIFIWSRMPNHKTDVNNRGGFSTDMIGENWDYPEGDYQTRAKIVQKHVDYTKGLLYFLGHDERIPLKVRTEMLRWGYPKDEFLTSDHFTPQLYIRESRRMIGRYVMTQADCESLTQVDDYVGWAAYTMDSHNCGRYVINGMVKNEGNVEVGIKEPYRVSYRSLTPKEEECTNLLVPVCLSASHIAYGSIRMEPVFMVLGQSAALAACQAIDKHHGIVQNVDAAEVYQQMESSAKN